MIMCKRKKEKEYKILYKILYRLTISFIHNESANQYQYYEFSTHFMRVINKFIVTLSTLA